MHQTLTVLVLAFCLVGCSTTDFYETDSSNNASEDKESAPSSTIDVPARLALDVPLEGAMLSYADGQLVLTWTNVIDSARVHHSSIGCGASGVGTG